MDTFEWSKSELCKLGFVAKDDMSKGLKGIFAAKVLHTFIEQRIHLCQSSLDRNCLYVVLEIAVRIPDFVGTVNNEDGPLHKDIFMEALTVEVAVDSFKGRGCGGTKNYLIGNSDEFSKDLYGRILPWLVSKSAPRGLISALQGEPDGGSQISAAKASIVSRMTSYLFAKKAQDYSLREERKRPISDKLIADLYYQLGEPQSAIPFMKRWIEFSSRWPIQRAPYEKKLAEIIKDASVAGDDQRVGKK